MNLWKVKKLNDFIPNTSNRSLVVELETHKRKAKKSDFTNGKKYSTMEVEMSRNEIIAGIDQVSTTGGGGGMDSLERRVENLERDVKEIRADLKEKTTKQDLNLLESNIKLEFLKQTSDLKSFIQDIVVKLPNEDRMKVVITEQVKNQDIATATLVKQQTATLQSKIGWWILGVAGTIIVALVVQIILLIRSNVPAKTTTLPVTTPIVSPTTMSTTNTNPPLTQTRP